ncbi:hypothetical protein [Puerhibacterium sp. TATVAM-FAB25]|uniref:hypothetical protein n=1 Tax=Puerhibacterium sp. TATVAM-FAB25 TaxID=3093699 RepID=UPI00397B3A9C
MTSFRPAEAMVRASSLAEAKGVLRAVGIKAKWARKASPSEARNLAEAQATFAWRINEQGEEAGWLFDTTVEDYLRR